MSPTWRRKDTAQRPERIAEGYSSPRRDAGHSLRIGSRCCTFAVCSTSPPRSPDCVSPPAIEKAGKVEKESLVDALEGLTIKSPTGPVTIEKNHHAAMNLFLAKTKGRELVTVRTLGEIKPDPRCQQ